VLTGDRAAHDDEEAEDVPERKDELSGRHRGDAEGLGAEAAAAQVVTGLAQPALQLVLQPEDADLLGRVGADREVEQVRRPAGALEIAPDRRHEAPEGPPRGHERRHRGEEEHQQHRLQQREHHDRDDELERARDALDGGADRKVERVPGRPEQLDPVRELGALVVLDPERPLAELAELAVHLRDVQVGHLDPDHVRDVPGDLVQEREDGQRRGGDRRRPDVAVDHRVGDVLERQRRERPADVLEQVQAREQGKAARARPPAAAQDLPEAREEVLHASPSPKRSAWRWKSSE
jgi:hypothetical protein